LDWYCYDGYCRKPQPRYNRALWNLLRDTYKDALQDMVDYLAWGQDENEGAWYYEPNEGYSDQSNSGYAVLGLEYAGAPLYGFECTIPAFVKTELNRWIGIIQNPVNGDEWDGGSAYNTDWGVDFWVNLLKTGNLLARWRL